MGITGIPQSVSKMNTSLGELLSKASGAWGSANIPSDGGEIWLCVCGEFHSLILHHLEFRNDCCDSRYFVTSKISSELPRTWMTTDWTMPLLDPLS